jgi:thymidylate kinase
VRAGYEALAAAEPFRWLRVDGARREDSVFEELWSGLAARGVLGEAGR